MLCNHDVHKSFFVKPHTEERITVKLKCPSGDLCVCKDMEGLLKFYYSSSSEIDELRFLGGLRRDEFEHSVPFFNFGRATIKVPKLGSVKICGCDEITRLKEWLKSH